MKLLKTVLLVTSSITQMVHCVSVISETHIVVTNCLADQSFQVAATWQSAPHHVPATGILDRL